MGQRRNAERTPAVNGFKMQFESMILIWNEVGIIQISCCPRETFTDENSIAHQQKNIFSMAFANLKKYFTIMRLSCAFIEWFEAQHHLLNNGNIIACIEAFHGQVQRKLNKVKS